MEPAGQALQGCSILVVEEEGLIAFDIGSALANAGAQVSTAHTIKQSREFIQSGEFGAVVLDIMLPDGDGTALCPLLIERGIPFLVYSGLNPPTDGPCKDAPFVSKPASGSDLLRAVEALLPNRN
jgi:DNA-binding response OmpR family regulator